MRPPLSTDTVAHELSHAICTLPNPSFLWARQDGAACLSDPLDIVVELATALAGPFCDMLLAARKAVDVEALVAEVLSAASACEDDEDAALAVAVMGRATSDEISRAIYLALRSANLAVTLHATNPKALRALGLAMSSCSAGHCIEVREDDLIAMAEGRCPLWSRRYAYEWTD